MLLPAGPQASLAARSAEAVGERESGAYADATIEEAQRRSRATVRRSSQAQATQWLLHQFGRQPLVVISAFELGYCVRNQSPAIRQRRSAVRVLGRVVLETVVHSLGQSTFDGLARMVLLNRTDFRVGAASRLGFSRFRLCSLSTGLMGPNERDRSLVFIQYVTMI